MTEQFHLLVVGFIIIFISFVSLKECNLDLFVCLFCVFVIGKKEFSSEA